MKHDFSSYDLRQIHHLHYLKTCVADNVWHKLNIFANFCIYRTALIKFNVYLDQISNLN